MSDALVILSTIVSFGVFLYLRFGIKKHLKQIVHDEFHQVVEEVRRLREEHGPRK